MKRTRAFPGGRPLPSRSDGMDGSSIRRAVGMCGAAAATITYAVYMVSLVLDPASVSGGVPGATAERDATRAESIVPPQLPESLQSAVQEYPPRRLEAREVYQLRGHAVELLRSGHLQPGLQLLQDIARKADGRDPVLTVWLGAATIMQADQAASAIDKMRYVDRGTQVIEDSMETVQRILDARLIVIHTYLSLPEFYTRHRTVAMELMRELVDTADHGGYMQEQTGDLGVRIIQLDSGRVGELLQDIADQHNLSAHERGRLRL